MLSNPEPLYGDVNLLDGVKHRFTLRLVDEEDNLVKQYSSKKSHAPGILIPTKLPVHPTSWAALKVLLPVFASFPCPFRASCFRIRHVSLLLCGIPRQYTVENNTVRYYATMYGIKSMVLR
jgi:hypothetical protein